jgi:hypothetical protein
LKNRKGIVLKGHGFIAVPGKAIGKEMGFTGCGENSTQGAL